MPLYMHQIAYSSEGWSAIIAQPQDRLEAVRSAIENLGGKVVTGWFSFGQYDVIAVTEMPDNVSAAAIAIAFAGGGACKSVNTTPLLTQEEALQAMRKAGESGYRPATTRRAA
ncbi:MAG: GYD domain-containing protein [Terriglobales bacterium]